MLRPWDYTICRERLVQCSSRQRLFVPVFSSACVRSSCAPFYYFLACHRHCHGSVATVMLSCENLRTTWFKEASRNAHMPRHVAMSCASRSTNESPPFGRAREKLVSHAAASWKCQHSKSRNQISIRVCRFRGLTPSIPVLIVES